MIKKYSKKAIISLGIGILNVVLTILGIINDALGNLMNFIVPASIAGVILGFLSLGDINGIKKIVGKKIAIFGIILNSILIILAIAAVIAFAYAFSHV